MAFLPIEIVAYMFTSDSNTSVCSGSLDCMAANKVTLLPSWPLLYWLVSSGGWGGHFMAVGIKNVTFLLPLEFLFPFPHSILFL